MFAISVTPEFKAVLAADLESLRVRLETAITILKVLPADVEAQAGLAAALHSLKGLAGMSGARPLGGAVAALEDVFERGVRLAREGDGNGARDAFGFCRGPAGEMALLINETGASRAVTPETVDAYTRLRDAASARWPEGETAPPTPAPVPDVEARDEADVLAFLQELGVAGPAGPVQPPSPPPPELHATLTDPLGNLQVDGTIYLRPSPPGISSRAATTPPASDFAGRSSRLPDDVATGTVASPSETGVPPTPPTAPDSGPQDGQSQVVPSTPDPAEEVDPEMLQYFVPETLEYCEAIDHALVALEENHAPVEGAESPRRVFLRMWHTIKGAANSIGLCTVGRMAHAVEDAWVEDSPLPPASQRAVAAMATDTLRDFLRDCAAAPAGTVPPPPTVSVNILLAHLARLPRMAEEAEEAEEAEARRRGDAETEGASRVPIEEAPALVAPVPTTPAATFEAPGARVDPMTLDRLMDLVGELTVSRNRLLAKVATVTGLHIELETCKNRLQRIVGDFQNRYEYSNSLSPSPRLPVSPSPASANRPTGFGALEFDEYDDLNLLSRALAEVGADTGELIDGSRRCLGDFSEESDRFRKVSTQLQETLTAVRMVPLSALFRRLRRVAVEAAGKEGKEIDWQTDGADTRLDRVIVEEVFGPLLHLVRNAVGHGIEAPERRAAAGKLPAGQLLLRASQRGGHALIELTDDGAGLNFHAIRARGLATGLLTAEDDAATGGDDERLVSLLFRPGFSTRQGAERNDVGGRGIGLDVVLQQVTRLGGTVEVESRPGAGCVWRLKLPITLAIGQAMFVEVGTQTFALPLAFVERLAFCGPGQVAMDADGAELLVVDGLGHVPLLLLENLLGLPSHFPLPTSHLPLPSSSLAVIVRVADKRLAFPVAGLGRRAEIVTKPLPALLADHPFFSGATIDNDGRAVLILDVPRLASGFFGRRGLFALVSSRTITAPPIATKPEVIRERLLVVDDSLSVRKVAEKLVRELGYDVETANDGQAALERLEAANESARPFAAVLTDLEMPRLDGFGLLGEIRARAAWRELPVIVVTSRQAEKHRQRAAELGATDYLVKPFTRAQLAEKLDAARTAPAPAHESDSRSR